MKISIKSKKKMFKTFKDLMQIRREQFEETYGHNWYSFLIKDEFYQDLCRRLAEIKLMGNPTLDLNKTPLSEEQVKNLTLGLISVDDFAKSINYI